MTTSIGTIVWFTGLSATGKTTLGERLFRELRRRAEPALWLDSDDLRMVMTPEPCYSESERDLFYRALGHIARRGAEGGSTVVVSATACKRAYRDSVRAVVPRFVEVLLISDPAILRLRDPKGLYRKAAGGAITSMPGIGAPYQEPMRPEMVLDTGLATPSDLLDRVLRYLETSVPRRDHRGNEARWA